MPQTAIPITAWLFSAIAVFTIIGAFAGGQVLPALAALCIVLYLALEFRRIPRPQQISGLVLAGLGVAALAAAGDWQSGLLEGISRSRVFLVLFFAVSWMQWPVSRSPALRATRATIVSQPPGRRFAFLTGGVHLLGSVLNLAGLGLLTTIVEKPGTDPALRKRLTLALMQGFTSASCWSPFYIGTIVVLIALPALTWRDLAPWGAGMAIVLMTGSWGLAQFSANRSGAGAEAPDAIPLEAGQGLRTIALLASLIGIVMVLVDVLDVPIPVILGIVAPPFALIWYASHKSAVHPFRELTLRAATALPGLRNETLLFVAANIFGIGVGALIPAAATAEFVASAIPFPDLRIVALILVFVATSAAGLHAVIVVISLSAVLPPSALGLPDLIVGLTYMGCWGMSTMISPFSGTTLFMSRATGVPAHVIGWRWSPPLVGVSSALIAATVIGLRHLLY